MGRTENLLMLANAVTIRNMRITERFEQRMADLARCATPRRRRRRTATPD